MSERMTDERALELKRRPEWSLDEQMEAEHEMFRARASEAEKEATIKALANALEKHARQVSCPSCGGIGSRTCATCDHGERPAHHPEVIKALRLAGRL